MSQSRRHLFKTLQEFSDPCDCGALTPASPTDQSSQLCLEFFHLWVDWDLCQALSLSRILFHTLKITEWLNMPLVWQIILGLTTPVADHLSFLTKQQLPHPQSTSPNYCLSTHILHHFLLSTIHSHQLQFLYLNIPTPAARHSFIYLCSLLSGYRTHDTYPAALRQIRTACLMLLPLSPELRHASNIRACLTVQKTELGVLIRFSSPPVPQHSWVRCAASTVSSSSFPPGQQREACLQMVWLVTADHPKQLECKQQPVYFCLSNNS